MLIINTMIHDYNKKFLVLDHDYNFQMKLKMQLLKLGINIDPVNTLEEAVKSLQNETPNMIFLELTIPDGKAFEFLKFRSQNSIIKKIPLMVITSTKNKEIIKKALSLGVNDFILKPININLFISKLEKHFENEESVKLEYDERPIIDVSFGIQMIALGKTMVQVEGPVRIPMAKMLLSFSSNLFTENEIPYETCFNVEESKFITTTKYKTLLQFLGTNIESSKKMEDLANKSPEPRKEIGTE